MDYHDKGDDVKFAQQIYMQFAQENKNKNNVILDAFGRIMYVVKHGGMMYQPRFRNTERLECLVCICSRLLNKYEPSNSEMLAHASYLVLKQPFVIKKLLGYSCDIDVGFIRDLSEDMQNGNKMNPEYDALFDMIKTDIKERVNLTYGLMTDLASFDAFNIALTEKEYSGPDEDRESVRKIQRQNIMERKLKCGPFMRKKRIEKGKWSDELVCGIEELDKIIVPEGHKFSNKIIRNAILS